MSAGWEGWRKSVAIILDFCDVSSTNAASLNTIPSLFGLRPDFNLKGKKVMDALEEIEAIKAKKPAINLALYTNMDTLHGVAEKIDLFAVPTAPPEIRKHSTFAWMTGITPGSWQLSLLEKGVLRVLETALGEFEVSKHLNGVKTPLGTAKTIALAFAMADKNVPRDQVIL
jgi:hypothetical protein